MKLWTLATGALLSMALTGNAWAESLGIRKIGPERAVAESAATERAGTEPAGTERGADGQVDLLYWQAPSVLNAYASGGSKDIEAGSLVLEPLAGYDATGTLFPRLAAEIPSLENGGISADRTRVTWKLAPGLVWSDGTPLTAEDVVFTAEYCMQAARGCAQSARFDGISGVEALDPQTVQVTFSGPRSHPFTAFVGAQSPILQKAQFETCIGPDLPDCSEQDRRPVGTGPFRVSDFRPGESAAFELNPHYRDPARPAFSSVTIRGAGDPESAARAVLETGAADYAWNTMISPTLHDQLAGAGRGEFVSAPGNLIERLVLNLSDPSPDLPAEERSTRQHPHPILSDPRVRKALSLAIDRQKLAEIGFGPLGTPACGLMGPDQPCPTQDLEAARSLLDEAGWLVGGNGVREKDGRRLHLLFQTSQGTVRQEMQSIIKQWWAEIGISTELKRVAPAVYFGSDPAQPDTLQRFPADVGMYSRNFDPAAPDSYFAQYVCDGIPEPGTQWQGPNSGRFCDEGFDALVAELGRTTDPDRRAEIAARLDSMLAADGNVLIPLVSRGRLSARSDRLEGVVINAWDSELWNIQVWTRAAP